jgi:CBS domain-containing protein
LPTALSAKWLSLWLKCELIALLFVRSIPYGIVTDTDMSSKIAGRFPIMFQWIKSCLPCDNGPENVSLAEAQLLMLKQCTHLCNRRINRCKGVISEHDLIVAQASNPGVLIKEIKRAQTSKE